MIVLDLYRSSLRLIGVQRPGQAPGVSWTTDVQFVANAMLDAWAVDRFLAFQIVRSVWPLASNVPSYQIGPGVAAPGFNMARPVKLDAAGIIDLSSTPNTESPLAILTDQQWENERQKAGNFVPIPSRIYYDGGNPIGRLTMLPTCSVANQLVLYTWGVLSQFVNLTDTVVFPPGYADMIRYNLAVRLAPEWGKEVPQAVLMLARESKQKVSSLNAPILRMQTDPAMRGDSAQGWYDYQTNQIK